MTELPLWFATQTWVPSEETAVGIVEAVAER